MAIVMSFVPSWPLTERQLTRNGFRDNAEDQWIEL